MNKIAIHSIELPIHVKIYVTYQKRGGQVTGRLFFVTLLLYKSNFQIIKRTKSKRADIG